MSEALDKAEAAAREAAVNSAAVQIALAAVELAKTAQAQQQAPAPHTYQQHDRRPGRSAGEWMAIGCAACIGSVGIAFAATALAIGGMTVAILALILRSIWRDIQKGK